MSDRSRNISHEDFRQATGTGVGIALIDTGVDSLHPELRGRLAGIYEVEMDGLAPSVNEVSEGRDPNAHGTACAGILARLAPGASIHSVQVIGDRAQDTPEKLLAGLRYAIAMGWPVINISAGIGRPNRQLQRLVNRAVAGGAILIAAKDNRPGRVGFPAAYPEVIAVDMEFFQDPLGWRYLPGSEVEVEASGIYIDAPRPGGGRQRFTGTSFAAPHVSAIAARLKERIPDLDTAGFREILSQDLLPPAARD